MPIICQTCNGRKFTSFEALHQHMNDSKKAHHFCVPCTRDFPSRAALVEHASTRHSETTCVAPTCQRIFANEDALRKHFFDSPKHPKCRACGVGFCDVKDQSAHKREAHGTTPRKKRSRPFSPTFQYDMSPCTSSPIPWIPTSPPSQYGCPSRSTPTFGPSQEQLPVDMLDVPFQQMLSPTFNDQRSSSMNMNLEPDFSVCVESMSTPERAVEGINSPSPRSSPRSRRSPKSCSSRSSSRSRSPRGVNQLESPSSLSPSRIDTSIIHKSLRSPAESLQTTHDERTTGENVSDPAHCHPLSKNSLQVNHKDSGPATMEGQPASPFDAHFLSQLNSDKGFSSPLLQTAAFVPTDAMSDASASEDELRNLTPVLNQQPRISSGLGIRLTPTNPDTPTDVGSSRPHSYDLKTILSRSTNRKKDGKTASLRTSALLTSLSSPSTSSTTDDAICPSPLFARLTERKEQSMHLLTGSASSPLSLPLRRPETRRRLSLSPTLAPIPESTLHEVPSCPLSRSDSDSDRESLGIFEFSAHDLLFGGTVSEDEGGINGGVSPPTSVALTDVDCEELGIRKEERQGHSESEISDTSDVSFSSPPPLIIEELNRMVREMCPSSPEEEDPFVDPVSTTSSPCASSPNTLRPLSPEKPSSHEGRCSPTVPPNDATLATSEPLRIKGMNGADNHRPRTITSVNECGMNSLSSEVRSPFTAPEDVKGEDVYLTPDEFEDDLPARSSKQTAVGDTASKNNTMPPRIPETDTQSNAEIDLTLASELLQDGSAQFIEENHPLGNLITLDSPLIATPWRSSLVPLSPPPSPGQNEQLGFIHDVEPLLPLVSSSSPRSANRESPPARMHCRLCMLDPCEDATATFCGHMFCYRCITREVVENAACPTCRTPTLLYCLFRLDLAS